MYGLDEIRKIYQEAIGGDTFAALTLWVKVVGLISYYNDIENRKGSIGHEYEHDLAEAKAEYDECGVISTKAPWMFETLEGLRRAVAVKDRLHEHYIEKIFRIKDMLESEDEDANDITERT